MSDMNCEEIRDRIEACIDGDLGTDERAALERHCAHCAACAAELRLAARVRDELRALRAPDVPARVLEAADRRAGAMADVLPFPTRSRRPGPASFVAAGLLAAAALAVWLSPGPRHDPGPEFSAAEIRHASEELALAFSYVDHYSAHAAEIVRDDVLARRVAPRIEHALEASGEAAIRDALVPGLRRAVRESGLDVTSPPPDRS